MMDSLRELIDARQDEVGAWLGKGLDIDMQFPSSATPLYRALLPEFNLVGKGESQDEAVNDLMRRLTEMMTTYMRSGEPLPDRSAWLAAHPDRPTGRGDE